MGRPGTRAHVPETTGAGDDTPGVVGTGEGRAAQSDVIRQAASAVTSDFMAADQRE